jgi:hypothetical protein
MVDITRRNQFWNYNGVGMAAGLLAGLVGGVFLFVVALLLVAAVLSAVLLVLATAIQAASLVGEDAQRALYRNLWVFAFVASTALAALAGCGLGVLFSGPSLFLIRQMS